MKLVLINQYYPPDTAPTGCYLHDLARTLVARGHEVLVVCSRRAYNGTGTYPAESILDGVVVRRVAATGWGRRHAVGKILDYVSFYLSLAWFLALHTGRPQVVVALTTPPHVGLLARWAARLRGARHVHWIMDIYPDVLAAHGAMSNRSFFYRVLESLTRRELRDSALVVGLGDDMAERLNRYLEPPARARSLPLWTDPALQPWPAGQVPEFRRQQGWSNDELVLMYSGNMGRGHRLGEFLEAARRLKGEQNARWVFAGGGKRRREVEDALARDPSLRLQLFPYAPAERLREHLCSADVHLVSLDSSWQGCMVPSKFQGIFAVGRPVILVSGPDNSLACWVRESGGGWVIPENDVEALVAAVRQAADPAERRRRGEAARLFAEQRFEAGRNLGWLADAVEGRAVGSVTSLLS